MSTCLECGRELLLRETADYGGFCFACVVPQRLDLNQKNTGVSDYEEVIICLPLLVTRKQIGEAIEAIFVSSLTLTNTGQSWVPLALIHTYRIKRGSLPGV